MAATSWPKGARTEQRQRGASRSTAGLRARPAVTGGLRDRGCFTGILVRLVTGCSWDVTARLTPAGETTLRNRRTEWLKAGVLNTLVEEPVAGYDKTIGPRANAASSTLLPSTASSLIWSL